MKRLPTTTSSLNSYLEYLLNFRRLSEVQRVKNRKWLSRIEEALDHPLIEANTSSEINESIIMVAAGRKIKNNGGTIDDGAGMRFRLGQAAVCYLRWAHGEGLIPRNPYTKNTFRPPTSKIPNHLNNQEKLEKIFKADITIKDRLAISILVDTGMRVSELCRLKVQDFDKNGQLFNVFMTKVNRPKFPVISKRSADLLNAWLTTRPKESKWIFNSRRTGHVTTHDIRGRFSSIGKKLGFRMNPHAFRHTTGSIWLENGAQETDVMTQLGLLDTKILKVYTHLSSKHQHKVLERVAQRVPVLA